MLNRVEHLSKTMCSVNGYSSMEAEIHGIFGQKRNEPPERKRCRAKKMRLSGVAASNQTKERAKRKVHEFRPFL